MIELIAIFYILFGALPPLVVLILIYYVFFNDE